MLRHLPSCYRYADKGTWSCSPNCPCFGKDQAVKEAALTVAAPLPSKPPRAKRAPRGPEPIEIRRARELAGLTQDQAARMLHTTGRVWRQWESGQRRMHPAFWELFTVHTGGD